jgi:hypothetical protein
LPVCSRPVPNTGLCYLQWNTLSATTSTTTTYVISMTVAIDGRQRAYFAGFFQNSFTAPSSMFSPGFKVPCGAPGASGDPALGAAYTYTLDARATGGLAAAVSGLVSCPADLVFLHLPVISGP